MINWDDEGQMTNRGQRIPIDVADKYEALRDAAMAIYAAAGHPWDEDADQQLERRVLNGLDVDRIIALTLEDRKARFDE